VGGLVLLERHDPLAPAESAAFDAKVAARKKADEEKRLRLAGVRDTPTSSRSTSGRTGFATQGTSCWCHGTT
jgi:hypothetical protein